MKLIFILSHFLWDLAKNLLVDTAPKTLNVTLFLIKGERYTTMRPISIMFAVRRYLYNPLFL